MFSLSLKVLPAMKRLKWRMGETAPKPFALGHGKAVVHGNTAYFSYDYSIYSFTVSNSRWTELPEHKYSSFAMAIVNGQLTTIGGHGCLLSNYWFYSESYSTWEFTKMESHCSSNTYKAFKRWCCCYSYSPGGCRKIRCGSTGFKDSTVVYSW